MQQTPQSERLHIAFFGRCNSGKSSLINALTGQNIAVVSNVSGTTTDPVSKPIELPGLGACVLIDTPGYDDTSILGEQRIAQTTKVVDKTDIAVLLFTEQWGDDERRWIAEFRAREIPIIAILSQCDRLADVESLVKAIESDTKLKPIAVSSTQGEGLPALREALAAAGMREERTILQGLVNEGDTVLLVMPQDASAPKGRLIQPQVQTIRELLDRRCTVVSCTTEGMPAALASLAQPPHLIITDSQVFDAVYKLKPEASRLTSFSVLFARYKGDITTFVAGAKKLSQLTENSRILIAEACTHVPQNEDIGRVKLPAMLRRKFGAGLHIDIVSGHEFPQDLTDYDLVIHCGACMFNSRHVLNRIARARIQDVPITNYGITIAALTGILDRIEY
ncbi:MAG: [Bacteroidaceae bacterium]|nr:[FeFe] hydrogenase H-cluster maturation GTPase HydF [Bacteroidaceae bacterium]